MNPQVARLLVVFTGFLALCSVGAAALLASRLQADRGALRELGPAADCAVTRPTKGGAR